MEMTLRKLQRLDTSCRAIGELAPSPDGIRYAAHAPLFNTTRTILISHLCQLLVWYEADQTHFHSRQALFRALVTVRYGFDKAARDLTASPGKKNEWLGGFGGGHLSKMVISD